MTVPFAVIGFSMLFAVTASVFFPYGYGAGAFFLLVFLGLWGTKRREAFKRYQTVSVSLLTVALTFVLVRAVTTVRTAPVKYGGETAWVTGLLLDVPEKQYGRYYYEVEAREILLTGEAAPETWEGAEGTPVKFRFRLSSSYPLAAEPYDRIQGLLRFYRFGDSFGLSSERARQADGILLGAELMYGKEEILPGEKPPLLSRFKALRHELSKGIRSLLPLRQGALMDAVLLGNRSGISEKTRSDFQESGLIHLLVVSGTHLSVVAFFLRKLFRFTGRRMECLLSFLGIVGFMLLVGLEPSVLRSGLTLSLTLLGELLGRESRPVNNLGFAVMVMCLQNPMIGGDAGFLLSVFSTLGIVHLYPRLRLRLKNCCQFQGKWFWERLLLPLLSALALGLCANLLILPLSAYLFGGMALAGPLATLLLIYPGSILLCCGGILCVLYLLGLTLYAVPFQLAAGFCAELMMGTAAFFAKFPLLRLSFSAGQGLLPLAGGLILLGLFCLRRDRHPGRVALFCGVCMFFFLAEGLLADFRSSHTVTLAVPDQGEDSCVLLLRGREAAILSLGGYRTHAAADLLAAYGIREVKLMILTDDLYQGTQGALSVLEDYRPAQIFMKEGFYTGGALSAPLSALPCAYLKAEGRTEMSILEGITGQADPQGNLLFSLPMDGKDLTVLVGKHWAGPESIDIAVTSDPTLAREGGLTLLQRRETWEEGKALSFPSSGYFLMTADHRTSYLEIYREKKFFIRGDL